MARSGARPSWVLLGTCVVLALPTAGDPGGPLAGPTYLAGLAAIVAAVWWGALRGPDDARRHWTLVALAASCWLAGDVVQRVVDPGDGVGLHDAFWLASYPLLVRAVIEMIQARGLPVALLREIRLDTAVFSVAATIWGWRVLVVPGLADGGGALTALVGTLYPLGDLAICALALTLVMVPGRRGAATWLLVGCLGLTLPLDFLAALLPAATPAFDTGRLDAALLVVNALLGAAALHPGRSELTAPVRLAAGHGMRRWRIVLLGASLCGVGVTGALPGRDPLLVVPTVAAGLVISLTVVVRFYLAVRDQERAEAALAHQAHHDRLTGAANRALLMDRLSTAVDTCDATLVFVDLDGFKGVNDRLGHPAGDLVLQAVAARLTALVRASDTVARVGGDEFVLLCHGVPEADVEHLGGRIVEAVREPVAVGGDVVRVGASVGVLSVAAFVRERYPQGGDAALAAADDLLRSVDDAMYEAKRTGGGVRTARPSR